MLTLIRRLWNATALGGARGTVSGGERTAAPAPPNPEADAAHQAVVLVHGMGEQIPMDTIKGFVTTVWEDDPVAIANGLPQPSMTWSKPDERTGSLELRRITTRPSAPSAAFPSGVRTDFYELYWADLTGGSTWAQFTGWVRLLLFRRLRDVPRPVRGAWFALWILSLLALVIGSLALLPEKWWTANLPGWFIRPVVLGVAAAVGALAHRVATATFGRVVRYTRADPANIDARAKVRARGLALLRALHEGNRYDRVILVGHSLGSILAYDLLSYFWSEQSGARRVAEGTPAFAAVCGLERAAAHLEAAVTPANRDAFRLAQARLRRALRADRPGTAGPRDRWLVSDLVTLGSPLTHAEFLLARDRADLDARTRAREMPTVPPYRETLDPDVLQAATASGALPIDPVPTSTRLMVFPDPDAPGGWILHHATPFAAVRWTNVHDPARWIYRGDLISGPLAGAFGPGVLDIDLSRRDRASRRFTHTRYWERRQAQARIDALREAVNLLDE